MPEPLSTRYADRRRAKPLAAPRDVRPGPGRRVRTSSIRRARSSAILVAPTVIVGAFATASRGATTFFVLTVALLVLLARAARARVVAADLRLVSLDRLGLGAVACSAGFAV